MKTNSKKADKLLVNIITYNSAPKIIPCLNSLKTQTYNNFQIQLIDNNSSDETLQTVDDYLQKNKSFSNKIVVIKNKTNVGFASGVNIGIKKIIDNNIFSATLLLNPDTYFQKDFLETGIRSLESDSSVGACCPAILYPDNRIWWVGTKLYSDNELLFGAKYSLGEHIKKGEKFNLNSRKIKYVSALTGCAMFIKQDVVKAVGLFNTKYFMYAEDIDYSRRVLEKGFKLAIFPSSPVIHSVEDKKKDLKKIVNNMRKYLIYLKSVSIYIRNYKPIHVFLIWLIKLPAVLIISYFKSKERYTLAKT